MDVMKTFTGQVVRGQQIGRTLGFPTINFSVADLAEEGKAFDLPLGVYAGRAHTSQGVFKAAIHFGERGEGAGEQGTGDAAPLRFAVGASALRTVGAPCVLEAHLLDCDYDFYGETVRIDVYTKLRDVQKFADEDVLKKQIAQDVQRVRVTE